MYDKTCINPVTGAETSAQRRRVKIDYELPMKEEYSGFLLEKGTHSD